MTKGQMAMIAAMAVSFPEKGTHNPKRGRPDQGKARAAKASGVSPARISQALLVKEHAPHLVQEVIDGTLALNAAYKTAQENERQRRWREDGVQAEFTRLFNQHAGAHPDKLARGCIEALFDYLLNPPELDPKQDGSGEDVVGPFEDEARQVEAKLLGMVRDEATAVCEFIPRHTSGGEDDA